MPIESDPHPYAGLDKILKKLFKGKLRHLPKTLQAGTCIFPPF